MDIRNVYGFTPKKASDLKKYYNISSIDALRNYVRKIPDIITTEQKQSLKYHTKVSHDIDLSDAMLHSKYLSKKLKNIIMTGSIRREEKKIGDLDMLITGSMDTTLDILIKAGYIISILSRDNEHSMCIVKIPNTSNYRRLDIIRTSVEEKPFALLYYTGDLVQITSMRQKARRMGYVLNQHGIFNNKGKPVGNIKTEEDIFNFLQIKYKEPKERVH